MTQLSELTDSYAKQNYFAALGTDNERYVPIIFAHHIYSFLYKLFSNFNYEVKYIEIIKPLDENIEKIFLEEFANYSPELIDYKSTWEIEHWFPSKGELVDKDLKIKITNMIKSITFLNAESLSDDDYLCYLPLCGNTLTQRLMNNKNNFILVGNNKDARQDKVSLFEMDLKKYIDISNKISSLSKKYQTTFDENISEARFFCPPKYIDNFKTDYLEELKRAQYLAEDKELYFFGSESYTAREGIDYLLGPNNYREYSLLKNLEKLPAEDRAFVFLNFHQLLSQNKQNDLADNIEERKLKTHRIIQGDNLQLISYFERYRKVTVPDVTEIKKIISGIFISLLVCKNKYIDRDWTLYPFVMHKLLDDLLSEVIFPEALIKAIDGFSEVSKIDLLENISFWYSFLEAYSTELAEINKNKVYVQKPDKEKWHVELDGKICSILSSYVETGPIRRKKFITYLLLLVRYTELDNTTMSVEKLRKSIIKYDGEKIPAKIDIETARIATSKIFNDAKKEHDWFNYFYNSFIKYENYEYSINYQLLELHISNFELKPNFFDNF
jgi:hypothetical protein